MTQRNPTLLVPLLAAGLSIGCAGNLRPGTTATVTSLSVLEEAQPGGPKPSDPRRVYRTRAGRVVPSGSRVTVLDQDAHGVSSGAPLAFLNRWHYVEVASSTVPAQSSWKGWLHRTALMQGEQPAPEPFNAELSRAARLCPDTFSLPMQCMQTIPAGTAVHIVRCEDDKAMVELWNAKGLYMAGFVGRHDVDSGCGEAGQ